MILKILHHGNLKVLSAKKRTTRTNTDIIPSQSIKWYENSNLCLTFKGSCLKRKKVTFTPPNIIKFFTVYELHAWSRDLNFDFTLKDCLFRGVNLAKNTDPDKYVCTGYMYILIIGFDFQNFHYLKVA